jgi:acyl-CoA thioester hydrolase
VTGGTAQVAGYLDGTAHIYPVRVFYEDTDAGGLVYHANYLKFAERGRTEMLRLLGVNHSEMAKRYGMGFAVRSCQVEFRRAARLDDLLEVRTRLIELRGASIAVEQAVLRGAELIAELVLRIVCLRAQERAMRIPDSVREILQPYVPTREQD